MKRFLLTLLLPVTAALSAHAQPFALSLNNVDGSPYTCNLLEDLGIYKRLKVVATQNSTNGTWEFPALCSFPGNVYRPYTSGTAPIPFNAIIPPIPGTAAALYNSGNGGASGNLSPITNGRLYTFNIQNTFSVSASPYFCVLETDYTPVTIPTVTQVPNVNAIGPNNVVEVTISCSSSPSPGENVFVRYTTDNFASTAIVQASFIGATGKATIPNFPFGTNVKYYVYSSSKTKALIESEAALYGEIVHDMSTLDWNTNISQNYQYTVTNIVPIRMEYLRGNRNGNQNDLSWKMSCSSGSRTTVTLERSANARDFSAIHSLVTEADRCNQPFTYRDQQVPPGISYYRLRIQEERNVQTYSDIIAIINGQSGYEVLSLSPTPVDQGFAKLNLTAGKAMPMEVTIFDLSGKQLGRQSYTLNAGSNQLTINVSYLSAGMYYLKTFTAEGQQRIMKFIKK